MPRKPPSYERLTRPQRREKKPYESLPAIFDPDKQIMPDGNPRFAPRHKLNEKHNTRPAKRQRLRDQLAVAWGSKSGQRALELAAHAVGGDVQDIPEYARESLATLTAWVFTMRAVSGSVEHFREIGDRIDPKPKRIEIEGVNGARRGGPRDHRGGRGLLRGAQRRRRDRRIVHEGRRGRPQLPRLRSPAWTEPGRRTG